METPGIAPKSYTIGWFTITETMVSAFLTTLILIIFAVIVRVFFIPKWRNEPYKKSGLRMLLEYFVEMFDGNSKEFTHKDASFTGAFYFGACAFILFSTLIEMFGLRPPLTDFNLTIMFGICTFIIIFVLGIRRRKARRLLHYAPIIPIITDAVVPVSIALRMFGSVFSGYLILSLIGNVTEYVLPAVGYVVFTIFHALIQAYVFMFLSFSLINEAVE